MILNEYNSSINNKLTLSDVHCMTLTILPDFVLFRQRKYSFKQSQLSRCASPFKHSVVSFMNELRF